MKTANTDSKHTNNLEKIFIIGLPNTGKSHTYNLLTGKYSIVANHPLTTIDIIKTRCKVGTKQFEITDTPGLHSLYIHSEEELIVREKLFTEKPNCIIQCIDANLIKQSLCLTAELIELRIPMVLVLNAIEETVKKEIILKPAELSEALKIPVVEIYNLYDKARERLKKAINNATTPPNPIRYNDSIEKMISVLEEKMQYDLPFKRKTATLLLVKDSFIISDIAKITGDYTIAPLEASVNTLQNQYSGIIDYEIENTHNQWVDAIYKTIASPKSGKENICLRSIASLSRHPVYGIAILLFFISITYLSVVYVAGFLSRILGSTIVDPAIAWLGNSVTQPLLKEFLIGHYGILTLGLFNAFCTVLPILFAFFIILGFMEDSGYLPNLTVLTNRLFKYMGISGKSIMPIVLGFGCKTMATLTTRSLQSKKEKYIAVFLIAFAIPCSVQLGLNIAILGKLGLKAFIITVGLITIIEIFAGVILNAVIKEESSSDFIQELPCIRIPSLIAIFQKTYYRLLWFLRDAIPLFVTAAAVLFVMDKTGVLHIFQSVLKPVVVNWLGLPINIVEALILTMARREVSAGILLQMVTAGELSYIQGIIAVILTTISIPCFANIVAICKELGTKTGISMAILINVTSFLLVGIIRYFLLLVL